jgi:phenylalanyl-tRNA synthetase beta chain
MLFSYTWLCDHLKYQISPQHLAELLTLHAYEVKRVFKKQASWLLDLEIQPNRAPDSFSHQGVALEANAIIAFQARYKIPRTRAGSVRGRQDTSCQRLAPKKLRPRIGKFRQSRLKTADLIKVEIRTPADCSQYLALAIQEVRVGPSPAWLQKRLRSLGVEPINNIVDITNFVMLDSGQPLHAFDLDKLESANPKSETPQPTQAQSRNPKQILNSKSQNSKKQKTIIVRRARSDERIKGLDGKIYALNPEVLVIASTKEPLAIAGIKGGIKASISKETRNLVLESANFNPSLIYRTARALKLKTDASARFSYGVPLSFGEPALRQCAGLIAETAGGRPASILRSGRGKSAVRKVVLDMEKLQGSLGFKIKESQARAALESLGFKLARRVKSRSIYRVPLFRLDIERPEDLVEEVGRLVGYENIPVASPQVALVPPEPNKSWQWRQILGQFLIGEGFEEVYNYVLTSKDQLKAAGISQKMAIALQNPLSARRKFLRPALTPGLIRVAVQSAKFYSQFKIFEIGKVFFVNQNKTQEEWHLAGLVAGTDLPHLARRAPEFFEVKGVIERLLAELGIDEPQFQETVKKGIFGAKNESLEILVNGELVGQLGNLSSQNLEGLELPNSGAAAFELNLEKLIEVLEDEREFEPVPKHPAVLRDLSVLVDLDVKASHILNIISQIGKDLIEDVELFDLYEGENLPEGKKSLAFHLIYRHPDKTLTDKEADQVHKKIEQALEAELKAVVR